MAVRPEALRSSALGNSALRFPRLCNQLLSVCTAAAAAAKLLQSCPTLRPYVKGLASQHQDEDAVCGWERE